MFWYFKRKINIVSFFQCGEDMTEITISSGVVHEVPDDLKETLLANPDVLEKWNKLTPIARNEWICWVTIVKKEDTRKEHLVRIRFIF